jgi:hypothetical protein
VYYEDDQPSGAFIRMVDTFRANILTWVFRRKQGIPRKAAWPDSPPGASTGAIPDEPPDVDPDWVNQNKTPTRVLSEEPGTQARSASDGFSASDPQPDEVNQNHAQINQPDAEINIALTSTSSNSADATSDTQAT